MLEERFNVPTTWYKILGPLLIPVTNKNFWRGKNCSPPSRPEFVFKPSPPDLWQTAALLAMVGYVFTVMYTFFLKSSIAYTKIITWFMKCLLV